MVKKILLRSFPHFFKTSPSETGTALVISDPESKTKAVDFPTENLENKEGGAHLESDQKHS